MIKYILIFSSLSIIYILANTLQDTNNNIILDYADSLVGTTINESSYREFYGNVKLRHRDVVVKCNYAKQYIEQNLADLQGNVRITQNTMLLQSPKIHYNGNSGFAYAYDSVKITDTKTQLKAREGSYDVKNYIADFIVNVSIEDDSVRILANRIIYNRINRISKAFGDVIIKGKFTDIIISADTIQSYPNQNYSIAYGKPILFKIDTTISKDTIELDKKIIKYDTLTISSDTMQSYRNPGNEYYRFVGNVEIVKGEIFSKCKEALYSKDLIILKDSPIVWYNNLQLYADSIIIKLENNNLKNIYAFNNAIMVTPHDTNDNQRYNQISGKDITIDIDSSQISKLLSVGQAKSLYYFADENGNNGVDRKSTDTIQIQFDESNIDKIYWIGQTVADFYPENLVFDEPQQFNLPLFKWNNNPPKRKSFILKPNINIQQ